MLVALAAAAWLVWRYLRGESEMDARERALKGVPDWFVEIARNRAKHKHVAIVAETGAGKSTLQRALFKECRPDELVVIVDPNYALGDWGGQEVPVVGAGNNWDEVEFFLEYADKWRQHRYQDRAAGRFGHPKVRLFVNEFTQIMREKPKLAKQFILRQLQSGREAGFSLTFVVHTDTGAGLNLVGEKGDALSNATLIYLGDKAYRACPASRTFMLDRAAKPGLIRYKGQLLPVDLAFDILYDEVPVPDCQILSLLEVVELVENGEDLCRWPPARFEAKESAALEEFHSESEFTQQETITEPVSDGFLSKMGRDAVLLARNYPEKASFGCLLLLLWFFLEVVKRH